MTRPNHSELKKSSWEKQKYFLFQEAKAKSMKWEKRRFFIFKSAEWIITDLGGRCYTRTWFMNGC